MLIYRCEVPECMKDFRDNVLKTVQIVVNDVKIEYEACESCAEKFKGHVDSFFKAKEAVAATPAEALPTV